GGSSSSTASTNRVTKSMSKLVGQGMNKLGIDKKAILSLSNNIEKMMSGGSYDPSSARGADNTSLSTTNNIGQQTG
ncbi:unnamed protein product, partial [Amoebophrya sp. A25]